MLYDFGDDAGQKRGKDVEIDWYVCVRVCVRVCVCK
jgi:hypothetical protein